MANCSKILTIKEPGNKPLVVKKNNLSMSVTLSESKATKSTFESPKLLTHFELVGEFHDTFGHPQKKEPYEDCFELEPKLVPFRISLITEESNEFNDAFNMFKTAYEKGDFIEMKKALAEMADALCDLSYVTNGAAQCLGVNLDDLAKKMNVSLDTPKGLSVNKNLFEGDSDVINDMIKKVDEGIKKKNSCIKMFCVSADTQALNEMCEDLVRILKADYDLGHELGFNMDLMFREVHRSNMTKVCSNIEDAKASIEFYRSEGRYKDPSIKIKGQYFVVYDASTSKILKNHKWENPNLEQFF